MTTDDKATALRHAARLGARDDKLDREMAGTIWLCEYTGASVREIADAAGLSATTVRQILDRAASAR